MLEELAAGSRVQVLSPSGIWRACTVVEPCGAAWPAAATTLLVHYEGYAAEHDEALDCAGDRRRVRRPGAGLSISEGEAAAARARAGVPPCDSDPQILFLGPTKYTVWRCLI